jgi:1-phosphofructokinase
MIYTITLNPTIDRTLYLEKLNIGEVNRAVSSQLDLAGKGVNVSTTLRNLGLTSVILGFAGGVTGQMLVQGLRERGLTCDFIGVSGETRSNVTLVDLESHVTTKLNELGPIVSPAEIDQLHRQLESLLHPDDLCVLCGSLPPGAPVDTYARLITSLKRKGVRTILDTSGAALSHGAAAGADWIKPNLSEAEELLGSPIGDSQQWAGRLAGLIAGGPQCILLTAGEGGAVFASAAEAWMAVPPPVTAASTVGAGDAALAGAIYAWQSGLPPRDIVHWAVAAGTAAVMQEGTRMPTLEQVRSIYGTVTSRLFY